MVINITMEINFLSQKFISNVLLWFLVAGSQVPLSDLSFKMVRNKKNENFNS